MASWQRGRLTVVASHSASSHKARNEKSLMVVVKAQDEVDLGQSYIGALGKFSYAVSSK